MNEEQVQQVLEYYNLYAVMGSTAVLAQSAPPRLFYSDLESGPNTGGQNNNGAFVTLWGKGFGAIQRLLQ